MLQALLSICRIQSVVQQYSIMQLPAQIFVSFKNPSIYVFTKEDDGRLWGEKELYLRTYHKLHFFSTLPKWILKFSTWLNHCKFWCIVINSHILWVAITFFSAEKYIFIFLDLPASLPSCFWCSSFVFQLQDRKYFQWLHFLLELENFYTDSIFIHGALTMGLPVVCVHCVYLTSFILTRWKENIPLLHTFLPLRRRWCR